MPKKILLLYGISLILILFGAVYVAVYTYGISGVFITHYDLMRGIDVLGSKADFYMVLVGVFLISLLNFYFSVILCGRIRAFAYLLGWFTLFINVLILLGVFYLISLNV